MIPSDSCRVINKYFFFAHSMHYFVLSLSRFFQNKQFVDNSQFFNTLLPLAFILKAIQQILCKRQPMISPSNFILMQKQYLVDKNALINSWPHSGNISIADCIAPDHIIFKDICFQNFLTFSRLRSESLVPNNEMSYWRETKYLINLDLDKEKQLSFHITETDLSLFKENLDIWIP